MLKDVIIRKLKNLTGLMTGCYKCMFCGDRSNWKPMIHVIRATDISGCKVTYLPCICRDCFNSQPLEQVLLKVDNGINRINNIYCSYGCEANYSEAVRELIIIEIKNLKKPKEK